MPEEFVMRGQTASGKTEVLNFIGYKPGYAYRLVEFQLFPSSSIGSSNNEFMATITAGKTAIAPTEPNFNDLWLIGSVCANFPSSIGSTGWRNSVVNDTFLITQNLIIMVQDTGGGDLPVNWQCRFVAKKMSGPQEAATNYKQYLISDGS